jgi:hypothetical protein
VASLVSANPSGASDTIWDLVPEITIAIATGPSGGLSLKNEIRLVKPALLYADSVTLVSPVASLLHAAVDVGASEKLTMALARQLSPTLEPQAAEAFAYYDELKRRRRPTREEKRHMAEFRNLLAENSQELHAKSREMMTEAGADELLPAIEAGLDNIDSVVRDDDAVSAVASSVAKAAGVESVYDSLLADSFMHRLQGPASRPTCLPAV